MTTNDVSLRMVRSRSQQAQIYARLDTPPEPLSSGYQPRNRAITLPTLKSVYGGRPVTYQDGVLMAGGEVVRVRRARP